MSYYVAVFQREAIVISDAIRIEVITSLQQFRAAGVCWDYVVRESAFPSVQMSHEWLCCWWRSFGAQADVVCLLLRDDDGPFCIAAFLLADFQVAGMSIPVLRMLGNDLSTRGSVISTRNREAAWHAIWGEMLRRTWLFFDHGKCPPGNDYVPYTDDVGVFQPVLREQLTIPVVGLEPDWGSWLATKSRKFRKNLRSSFSRTSSYRVSLYAGGDMELESFIQAIEEVSAESWSHAQGTSLIGTADTKAFIGELLRSYSRDGRLVAVLLADDSKTVAFAIGVRFGERIFGLKTAYRESYAARSVGMRVMAEFVRACMNCQGTKWLDMDYITDHGEYKRHWADHFEYVVTYRVFRHRPVSAMLSAIYRIRKFLRDPKSTENAISQVAKQ